MHAGQRPIALSSKSERGGIFLKPKDGSSLHLQFFPEAEALKIKNGGSNSVTAFPSTYEDNVWAEPSAVLRLPPGYWQVQSGEIRFGVGVFKGNELWHCPRSRGRSRVRRTERKTTGKEMVLPGDRSKSRTTSKATLKTLVSSDNRIRSQLGRGGAARVFKVTSPAGHSQRVAKIFEKERNHSFT